MAAHLKRGRAQIFDGDDDDEGAGQRPNAKAKANATPKAAKAKAKPAVKIELDDEKKVKPQNTKCGSNSSMGDTFHAEFGIIAS